MSKQCDGGKKNVMASKSWLIRLVGMTGPLPAPARSPPAELAARARHRPWLEVVSNAWDVPGSSG